MSTKKLVLLAVLVVFSLLLFACGDGYNEDVDDQDVPQGTGEADDTGDDVYHEDLPIMTMNEVEQNDGRDGRNAYVVVDGIVYDVTDSPNWPDGNYEGNQAGQDLSDEIKDSPDGLSLLDDSEPIGRIE